MDQIKTTTQYATPKHVFLHLLMIAMLYVTVIASITLYFQYINTIFFDSTVDYYTNIFDTIHWASAILIVAYPVYVYINWLIHKEIHQHIELRQMKTRRWLLYFTQFITAITIIIDLMVLIYQFFGGDITLRFVLKVLVVLVIAALVLGYNNWELHHADQPSRLPKIVAIIAAVILVGSIVGGFFVAGTPSQQRAIRLDGQRVNDLMLIQNQAVNYLQSYSALPTDLAQLTSWSGTLPLDPDTQQPYVYTTTSATTFQVCATFVTAETKNLYGNNYYAGPTPVMEKTLLGGQLIGNINWVHPAGYFCFDRTVTLPVTPPAVQ